MSKRSYLNHLYIFDKKSSNSGAIVICAATFAETADKTTPNQQLVDETHKLIIKKF